MPKAEWNGVTIADTTDTVVVENNHYFAASAIDPALLTPSPTTSICGWKGTAHYYNVVANGQVNKDAAWYYPDPKDAAKEIKGRLAFWKGVRVS